jgi:chromosome segregation ATPase
MGRAAAMADQNAATRPENDWPAQGVRQRLGGRIERHVLRSAVEMLDERGAELDTIERDLVKREHDIAERLATVDAGEAEVERREHRLAEIGAAGVEATRKIDLLIRELDQTETAAATYRAKAEGKLHSAEEKARDLGERVKRLEEAEHRRVLSAADITRRESALRSREHELRGQDERLRERDQALGARQHALIAQEQKLEERQRHLEAVEQDARKRLESLERLERELDEREAALRGRDQRWWGSGPASTY